jgi:hypothetical protein
VWQGFLLWMALSCLGASAFAQPDSLWSRMYGQYGEAWGISALQTADGGYLLTGSIEQGNDWNFYLQKTAANGGTVWERSFGMGRYDGGGYLAPARDGGYVLAGTVWTKDMYLLKISAGGDSLWSHEYGRQMTDNCTAIEPTVDGGFLLAGYRQTGLTVLEGMILKTDANGDSLWSRIFDSEHVEAFHAVRQTPDGGYILSGQTNDSSAGGYDVWLMKTDSMGNTIWQRIYGGLGNDIFAHVQLCPDGGYIVAATTTSYGAGGEDIWLLKTNAQGDSLWSKSFGGTSDDETHSVRSLPDGGFVIGAHTASYGGDDQFWLIRMNADGDSLWSRVFGTAGAEWCNDVLATTDGGFALFGAVSLLNMHQAAFLLKTGPDPLLSAGASFSLPPSSFTLSNYPNPFNSSTWVSFDLPKAGSASLKVFDVLGREVAVLRDGPMPAGSHRLLLDGTGLASGSYVLRLDAGGAARATKITLLK